jgi:hypothetical protein
MRFCFSTDDILPGDRLQAWCDHLNERAYGYAPGGVPDSREFQARMEGLAAGRFILMDIRANHTAARRTAAHVARDTTRAFAICRFNSATCWKAAPRSTPVDIQFAPGDWVVTSSEWEFDAIGMTTVDWDVLVIPHSVLSPLLTGGRLIRPIGMQHVLDQLDGGAAELALSTLTEGGDRFKCVGLLEDEYVVILSNAHRLAAEPELSIDHFATLPHVVSTSGGDDSSALDDALAEQGLARHVVAKVPLHSLIFLLIGSNSLSVVPRRVASALVAICPLIMRPLPFPSPLVSISMIWHRRLDNHPAHRWLRATLRASVTEP